MIQLFITRIIYLMLPFWKGKEQGTGVRQSLIDKETGLLKYHMRVGEDKEGQLKFLAF